MKEVSRPIIIKHDHPLLLCMEQDAGHLLNWIQQARGSFYKGTDFIKKLRQPSIVAEKMINCLFGVTPYFRIGELARLEPVLQFVEKLDSF